MAGSPRPSSQPNTKHDPSEVAVLSWRWGTNDNQPSKNVLAVIRYAKQKDIKFLFLDVIATEQTVDSNQMIAQVLDFSRLYKTIPVIAAYDSNDDFTKTMRRPWIAHEVHASETNPYSVTYDLVLPGLTMISFSAMSRLRSGDTSTTTTWILKMHISRLSPVQNRRSWNSWASLRRRIQMLQRRMQRKSGGMKGHKIQDLI